jgi:hypothetical protein
MKWLVFGYMKCAMISVEAVRSNYVEQALRVSCNGKGEREFCRVII